MIITGRDFRANQSKYISIAQSGGDEILKFNRPVDTGERAEPVAFSEQESQLMEDARRMTEADVERIRRKEDMTVEESQMLLLRMVEEEYLLQ